MLNIPEANILGKFTDSKFRQFRQVAVQAIRSTDISFNLQMRDKLAEMGAKLSGTKGDESRRSKRRGFSREELVTSKTVRELMWGVLVHFFDLSSNYSFNVWFLNDFFRFSEFISKSS